MSSVLECIKLVFQGTTVIESAVPIKLIHEKMSTIYKVKKKSESFVNQEGGGLDSEEENEKLQELESALRQHSPEFLGDATASKPTSLAENYQIELSTEQVSHI